MMPDLDSFTGNLPLGRFNVPMVSLKKRFVDDPEFSDSSTRAEIWTHFEEATSKLRKEVPVAFVWIGGSFITNRIDPDDIDVVYWCDDRELNKPRTLKSHKILWLFAANQLRPRLNLRVDSRYCGLHLHPGSGITDTIPHVDYVALRGFWDDFWSRRRSGNKDAPPCIEDAFPRRGYIEVTLDALHEN